MNFTALDREFHQLRNIPYSPVKLIQQLSETGTLPAILLGIGSRMVRPAQSQGVTTMTARLSALHNTVAVLGAVLCTAALVFVSTPLMPIA